MKKNAFTLMELLAVIVILAIISLIAVPIVINMINDSKNSGKKETIKMYAKAVENALGDYFIKNQKENNVTVDKLKNLDLVNYNGERVECEIERIGENGNIYLAQCKVGGILVDYEYGEYVPETIGTDKSYRGYYADVDRDGNPDGFIYADLAFSKSGEYSYASYSYEAMTNLKEYTISREKYNGDFGEMEIITPKLRNKGNERFYMIALSDVVKEGTLNNGNNYYWYKNAQSKMNTYATDTSKDFGTGYTNTGTMIKIWNKNGEGDGSYLGATQDNADLWKYIQDEYKKGWYVPSIGEWDAFYDYLVEKENGLIPVGKYNLATHWSSSQENENYVWITSFGFGYTNTWSSYNLRLGKTF